MGNLLELPVAIVHNCEFPYFSSITPTVLRRDFVSFEANGLRQVASIFGV
jgi:hypothetical protein